MSLVLLDFLVHCRPERLRKIQHNRHVSFVFGYRASRMRQGKLSELIHILARYSDLDEWSVEVYFREIIDLVCVFLQFWPSTE